MTIDHIAIAVKSLKDAVTTYENILGVKPDRVETVESEQVKVAFFQVGEVKIELMEPLTEHSTVAKFVARKGEGLHHIAFTSDKLKDHMEAITKLGFPLVGSDRDGAGGTRVCFLHPKAAHGVLIEWVEKA